MRAREFKGTEYTVMTLVACVRGALLGSAVFLSACATRLPSAPNPADGNPEAGTIVFYRTMRGFGYGQRGDILLDDRVVARSVPGEKFVVRALPGQHVVRVPNFLYSGEQRLRVEVRSRETVYVRTATGAASLNGVFDLEEVDQAVAAVDLVDLEKVKH